MNYTALDISSLSWLLPELKTGVETVRAELLRAQDTDAKTGALQLAKAVMHEACGALQIMDAKGLTQYAQTIEAAISFAQQNTVGAQALDQIDDACHAIISYLLDLQAQEKGIQPIVLFAHYQELNVLMGLNKYQASDLYYPPLTPRAVQVLGDSLASDELVKLRRNFEHYLLPLLKQEASPQDYQLLNEVLIRFAEAQKTPQTFTFWYCCAVAVESLMHIAAAQISTDIDMKQWFARLNIQLRRFVDGNMHFAESMLREALFFIAYHVALKPEIIHESADIKTIVDLFSLRDSVPSQVLQKPYPRVDDSLLAQLRHRLKTLKVLLNESIEKLSNSEGAQLPLAVVEQRFLLARQEVAAIVQVLRSIGMVRAAILADAIRMALEKQAQSHNSLQEQMGLDAASAVLLIEQSLDSKSVLNELVFKSTTELFLNATRQKDSQLASTGEKVMLHITNDHEALQLNTLVTKEMSSSLSIVEKWLDVFFRNPRDVTVLNATLEPMTQLKGSFQFMDLPVAVQAITAIERQVKHFIERVSGFEQQQFVNLAENFGRLSLMIEAFGKNPEATRAKYVFDTEHNSVTAQKNAPINEEQAAPIEEPASIEATLEKRLSQARTLMDSKVQSALSPADKSAIERSLTELKEDAVLIGNTELSQHIQQQLSTLKDVVPVEPSLVGSLTVEPQPTSLPAAVPIDDSHVLGSSMENNALTSTLVHERVLEYQTSSPLSDIEPTEQLAQNAAAIELHANNESPSNEPSSGLVNESQSQSFEHELLAIFLEEAGFVLDSIPMYLSQLQSNPSDTAVLTDLKRAFHTLKGSGRMVGLTHIGNASWLVEKYLNEIIATHKLLSDTDLSAVGWACQELQTAVKQLEHGGPEEDFIFFEEDFSKQLLSISQPEAFSAALATNTKPTLEETFNFDTVDASDNKTDTIEYPTQTAQLRWSAQTDTVPVLNELALTEETSNISFPDVNPTLKNDSTPIELSDSPLDFDTVLNPTVKGMNESIDFAHIETKSTPNTPLFSVVTDNSGRLPEDFGLHDSAPFNDASKPVLKDKPTTQGVKVVGPIQLPLPLFNIYVTESQEYLLQLEADIDLWASEPHRGSTYDAYRFAHSLKGGAATVGFGTLRDVASGLESVLDVSHKRNMTLDGSQFALIVRTTQRLVEMHAQFAQGVYPAGDIDLIRALADLSGVLNQRSFSLDAFETFSTGLASKPSTVVAQDAYPVISHDLDDQQDESTVRSDAADITAHVQDIDKHLAFEFDTNARGFVDQPTSKNLSAAAPPAAATVADDFFATLTSFSVKPLQHALSSESMVMDDRVSGQHRVSLDNAHDSLPTDDAIAPISTTSAVEPHTVDHELLDQFAHITDEIEADILADFLQEAQDWMPLCQSLLASLPSQIDNAAELKRGWHTLKGGARMAGAMKLGAVFHTLESLLEDEVFLTDSSTINASETYQVVQQLADYAQNVYDGLLSGSHHNAPLHAKSMPTNGAKPASEHSQDQQGVTSQHGSAQHASNTGQIPAASMADMSSPNTALSAFDATKTSNIERNQTLPAIRLRTQTLDRLVNQAGEVTSSRGRLDQHVLSLRQSLKDLTDNVDRLTVQLREVEIQAESQLSAKLEQTRLKEGGFDPLELDKFTRFQELTRMLNESLADMVSLRDTVSMTLTQAESDLGEQAKLTKELSQSLMRTRLTQFDIVSDRLYRTVRQVARDLKKQVELDVLGGTVELDRSILERMIAPLEHLVRNAVAHGIETSQVRLQRNKNPIGKVTVSVRQVGNEIEMSVQDDGAGLDFVKIRHQAIAKGLLAHDAPNNKQLLAEMIFIPGFSTASELTEVSGRGIGMDVVRSEAASLGGRVNIELVPSNNGTEQRCRFVVRLPLTLAVNQVLMVGVGDQTYAIPAALIESLVSINSDELSKAYQTKRYDTIINQQAISYPFAYLGSLLETEQQSMQLEQHKQQVLLINSGDQRVAIHVDRTLGNHEVVVKNIGAMLSRIQGINSATLLSEGQICLILDPSQLWLRRNNIYNAISMETLEFNPEATQPDAVQMQKQTFNTAVPIQRIAMVVDDSLTVRKVTQKLLLRHGWNVLLAKDGVDALEQLQGIVPHIMLMDIEMPRMDGFDLTRNMKSDPRLSHVPMIMITSRMADKHRQHALDLGVDAYLGKPYHEDTLIKQMDTLVPMV